MILYLWDMYDIVAKGCMLLYLWDMYDIVLMGYV